MAVTVLPYVLAVVVIAVLYFLKIVLPHVLVIYRTRKALLEQFPTPDYHPLAGHAKQLTGFKDDTLEYFYGLVTRFPRYFVFMVGPTAALQLVHPETIKQLTKTAEGKPLQFGGGYKSLYPWLGDGLLMSRGSKWFRNRRLLTPGFHFDVLKPYMKIYNEAVEKMMAIFEREAADGGSVEISRRIGHSALEVILRCAFSSDIVIQGDESKNPYRNLVNAMCSQIADRAWNPLYMADALYFRVKAGKDFMKNVDISHKNAQDVITKRRSELRDSDTLEKLASKRYIDFLDILLMAKDEQGNGLTNQEILDEVETFMFEGHDTTSSGMSWAMYNLAKHPEIQAKAREEVDALLAGRESDDLLWDDLTQLPYMTQCIKESMRLDTPVPFISRQIAQPIQIDGKTLPVGTVFDINLWALHHNPAVWSDPMTYDPDRFSPERMAKMDSHAFMPFSAGPRNCIGQNFAMNEMKTMISRVLRRFELSVDATKGSVHKLTVVMKPENGLYVHFKKREGLN